MVVVVVVVMVVVVVIRARREGGTVQGRHVNDIFNLREKSERVTYLAFPTLRKYNYGRLFSCSFLTSDRTESIRYSYLALSALAKRRERSVSSVLCRLHYSYSSAV
jgi:hypothetical protein